MGEARVQPKIIGCDEDWREMYADMVRGTGNGVYILPWNGAKRPKVIYCNSDIVAVVTDEGLYALVCNEKTCRPLTTAELARLYSEIMAVVEGAQPRVTAVNKEEESQPSEESPKSPLEVSIEDLFGDTL